MNTAAASSVASTPQCPRVDASQVPPTPQKNDTVPEFSSFSGSNNSLIAARHNAGIVVNNSVKKASKRPNCEIAHAENPFDPTRFLKSFS